MTDVLVLVDARSPCPFPFSDKPPSLTPILDPSYISTCVCLAFLGHLLSYSTYSISPIGHPGRRRCP
jgi:hypothetical protein